jgi:hypothetical protein
MPSSKALATQMLTHAAAAPRCQHIRLNNQRCGSPARKNSNWCVFHAVDYEGRLPVTGIPEDAATIQIEIARVIRALQSSAIEPRAAALILYGLQIASQNLKRLGAEMPTLEELEHANQAAEDEEAFPQRSQDLGYYMYTRLKAPPERRNETLSRCVDLARFVRGDDPAAPAAESVTADSSPAAGRSHIET